MGKGRYKYKKEEEQDVGSGSYYVSRGSARKHSSAGAKEHYVITRTGTGDKLSGVTSHRAGRKKKEK